MKHLVGGVSSSARVIPVMDGTALNIVRSLGAYLHGDDGRRYVDTALGFGGILLGHANPAVVEASIQALQNGSLPAFSHPGEEEAAAVLASVLGPLKKVILTNTGSEAVHLACRIARTVTGRKRVAKMAAGFDGWLDEIAFGNVNSPEAAFGPGQRPSNERTTLLRFNDFDDVERLFAENDDIAAVVYEPILANAACLMPAEGYLEHVQEVARRHHALLIADEVLMGFRLHAGLSSHLFGLDPDLTTLGKAVGNGVPVAAVAAKPEVMDAFHAANGARAGTYSGNPLACAAVIATIPQLLAQDYAKLLHDGDVLRTSIVAGFAAEGLPSSTSGFGNVFGVWFCADPPSDYADAERKAAPSQSLSLHFETRRRGVLVMPSPYGRLYTSFSHDAEAMDQIRAAFAGAAKAMAAERG